MHVRTGVLSGSVGSKFDAIEGHEHCVTTTTYELTPLNAEIGTNQIVDIPFKSSFSVRITPSNVSTHVGVPIVFIIRDRSVYVCL